MDLFSLAVAIGIPSAITGFCFWCLEHHMEKREEQDKEERKKRQKEQDEREQAREKSELCIINCINASLALGEATAKAVQRIPDAKCNGDMHAALDYELEQKHDLENFLTRQGVNHITGE